jgi:hypothetical protein
VSSGVAPGAERAVAASAVYGENRLALFERRLCRRNPMLGEVSKGAVEAPSEDRWGVALVAPERVAAYRRAIRGANGAAALRARASPARARRISSTEPTVQP